MQPCNMGDRASLYALGLLDEAESSAFAEHLSSCGCCEEEVRRSGELAVELARTLPTTDPPAALRARVLNEAVLPRGVMAFVRGAERNWQPTSYEGVSIAKLYEDPVRGELASLIRMQPGACFPAHHHSSIEHCYVVEGDLVFEDYDMAAGDYSAGSPGKRHTSATTTKGCTLFIVQDSRVELYVH